jgi:hypothetical protein
MAMFHSYVIVYQNGDTGDKWGFPKIGGTPKSSTLKGCSLTKTIDVGVSPFMETMVFLPKMVASPT